MAATKAEVAELVEELERYKGKHTEFITVYIPAGYDSNTTQKQIEAEKATAKNIKSTTTRKNVIDALGLMLELERDESELSENTDDKFSDELLILA